MRFAISVCRCMRRIAWASFPTGLTLQHDTYVAFVSWAWPCIFRKHIDHYNANDQKCWGDARVSADASQSACDAVAHLCHVHWPWLSQLNRDLGDVSKYIGWYLCGISVWDSHRIRGEAATYLSLDDATRRPSEWQFTGKWCIAPHGYNGICSLFFVHCIHPRFPRGGGLNETFSVSHFWFVYNHRNTDISNETMY